MSLRRIYLALALGTCGACSDLAVYAVDAAPRADAARSDGAPDAVDARAGLPDADGAAGDAGGDAPVDAPAADAEAGAAPDVVTEPCGAGRCTLPDFCAGNIAGAECCTPLGTACVMGTNCAAPSHCNNISGPVSCCTLL